MPLVNKTFSDIITFSRGSNATMFDSSGTLVYAPANLLLWSEDFSQAAWTQQSSVSVSTDTTVAPNGTTTADTITADSGFGVYQSITVTIGERVTQSVYLKAGTAAAVMVRDDTGAGRHIVVNPSTGVITSTSGTLIDSGSISMGNGWYRVYFSYAADTVAVRAIVRPDSAGAGQTFILWGAQTNFYPMQGGVTGDLSTYYPTTSAAYYGPRLDYDPATLAARGLLIEEQRTNSIRNNTMQGAVAGTPGTAPTNWAIATAANGIDRDIVGTGTENGITYIDVRFYGTATAAYTSFNLFESGTFVVALSGQTWTDSAYFKLQAGATTNVTNLQLVIDEINIGGSLLARTATTISPTSAALSTQRVVATRPFTDATTAFARTGFRFEVANGAAIDITLRIGLPQLELGAFATSVIPTTTTALTRSADVAAVNTLSPWFNGTEGTLFAEFNSFSGQLRSLVHLTDGTINNRVQFFSNAGDPYAIGSRITFSGVTSSPANTGSIALNAIGKAAITYAVGSAKISVNGGAPATASPAATPTGINVLGLGNAIVSGTATMSGHLRRVTYYPRALSSAELQAITA